MPNPNEQPAGRQKPLREQLREQVNETGVEIVQRGFDAIDELAEQGRKYLKRELLKALTGKTGRKKIP